MLLSRGLSRGVSRACMQIRILEKIGLQPHVDGAGNQPADISDDAEDVDCSYACDVTRGALK